MQLKVAAFLLVWATFYCALRTEGDELVIARDDGSLKDVEPIATTEDENSAEDVEPTGTMGDEESPKDVKPTGTMGDEDNSKEVELTGTIRDEESPREIKPTGTMGDEESPKDVEPTGTTGDEESPKDVEPAGTTGDEESPKEIEPTGTMGDEESPKDVEPTGTTGDEESAMKAQSSSHSSDTNFFEGQEMSQTISADSVNIPYDGRYAEDASVDLNQPQEAASECSNYIYLTESDRAASYTGVYKCDNALRPGWYRFQGSAGYKMPDVCVSQRYCGTHAPGWLDGGHPTVAQGAVDRRVCFHWSNNCCHWNKKIRVRNCGSFYVYFLYPPPICRLRYCGDKGLECRSYLSLSEYHRAQSYTGLTTCDRLLKPSWYRITGLAGNRMPDSCVPKQRCGTHAPGWLVGGHPTVAQGSVARRVCFHWLNSCCRWSAGVLVRNCGLFYTYYLTPPPTCNLRYCGNRGGAVIPAECRNYRHLSEYDRAQGYKGVVKCDNSLAAGWYRITGLAGNKMPDSCVLTTHCGTHAPGWLVGGHPTVAQGAVFRKVCFHWSNNCCRWYKDIRVRNCGSFYVYYLLPPPTCRLRYCGNRLPAPVPSECIRYRILSEGDRATRSTGVLKCDRSLPYGWYRFNFPAGYKMPDSVVSKNYCGTHAPGWMVGGHPTKAQGVVLRKVCFHWLSNHCLWSRYIRVRNCGPYYVYYLGPTPVCHLRYCGATT